MRRRAMNKRSLKAMGLACCWLVLGGQIMEHSVMAQESVALIQDRALEEAILAELDVETGNLTKEDLLTLTSLDASRGRRGNEAPLIKSLQGIEAAANLETINLQGNGLRSEVLPNVDIRDYSPLLGLPRLKHLDLSCNALSVWDLPVGLSALEELKLNRNNLSALRLESGFSRLTKLDLRRNQLSHLEFSESMPSLAQLRLNQNQLSESNFLTGPANLELLDLRGNQLSILNPRLPLVQLKTLDVSNNQLRELDLNLFPQLTHLYAEGNQLKTLSFGLDQERLCELHVGYNELESLEGGGGWNDLSLLDARNNRLTTFDSSESFPSLKELYLGENQLSEFELSSDFPELNSVDVSGNRILALRLDKTSLTLKWIDAVDNDLTRFVIGGTLPELRELFLSENRIAADRFLTFLPRLKYLSLKGNALTQVDFYHQRESLEGVNLLQMPLGRVQLPRSVGLTLPSVLELAAMGIPVVRPVVIQSIEFRPTEASVSIGILADRGEYDVLMSADLAVWTPIGEIGVVDQYVTTVGKFTVDSSVPARFFQVRYGD
jgi:Leucine-rich repeat (LRR) protein